MRQNKYRYWITQRNEWGVEVTISYMPDWDGDIDPYIKRARTNKEKLGVIKVTREININDKFVLDRIWSYNMRMRRITG